MSNEWKFTIEDGRYILEGLDSKFVYSNPYIQARGDSGSINSREDILFFYYTLEIYKKVRAWSVDDDDDDVLNETYEYELVSEREMYDFPGILWFEAALDDIMKLSNKEVFQKCELANNLGYVYTFTHSNIEFVVEDAYEITKKYGYHNKVSYSLYIGNSLDWQGNLNSVGMNVSYINNEDIKVVKKWVTSFIDYALKHQTKLELERIKSMKGKYFTKNGKLYGYLYDGEKLNKNALDEVFTVNDESCTLDIDVYVDDGNGKFHYDNYKGVTIKKINKTSIEISTGEVIPLKKIVEIFDDFDTDENAPKNRLYYNMEQMVDDLIELFDEDEINEFREKSIEDLMDKYYMLIIDRFWLCRFEEHWLKANDTDGNDEDYIDNVEFAKKHYIGSIIEQIKAKIN
jgi:hypothetical protein